MRNLEWEPISAVFPQDLRKNFLLRITRALTITKNPPTLAKMVPSPHAAHAGNAPEPTSVLRHTWSIFLTRPHSGHVVGYGKIAMRICFSSLTRPKRVSKLHARLTGLKLGAAQNEIAYVLGYTNWNELHQAAGLAVSRPSPDDEDLSLVDLATRLEYQVTRLMEHRSRGGTQKLPRQDAERIIHEVRPSARIRNALDRPSSAHTQDAPSRQHCCRSWEKRSRSADTRSISNADRRSRVSGTASISGS